jgi:hypothetical protein
MWRSIETCKEVRIKYERRQQLHTYFSLWVYLGQDRVQECASGPLALGPRHMDDVELVQVSRLFQALGTGVAVVVASLTLYPILSRYSIISGIANSDSRPPEARTASRVAALDWSELRHSTASAYVRVPISLRKSSRAERRRQECEAKRVKARTDNPCICRLELVVYDVTRQLGASPVRESPCWFPVPFLTLSIFL